jgi:hypothetical protein
MIFGIRVFSLPKNSNSDIILVETVEERVAVEDSFVAGL